MKSVYNSDLASQMKALTGIVSHNEMVHEVMRRVAELKLASYYIGAGCIAQSIWNAVSGERNHRLAASHVRGLAGEAGCEESGAGASMVSRSFWV